MDSCDACQYVYASVKAEALPERLAAFGPRCCEQLLPDNQPARWHDLLRLRPTADTWSALEYACHLRDVFLVQRDRLYTTLVEEKPTFTPMYRDERATLAQYNAQDPEAVAHQLTIAAQLIAQAFQALHPSQLTRLCIYNFPARSERSLLWVGQHVIHEGEHHLRDITLGLTRARSMEPG